MQRRASTFLLFLVLSACGQPSADDSPPAEALEASDRAVTCSASELSWSGSPTSNANRCAGPWQYRDRCFEALPACPDDTSSCKQHASCDVMGIKTSQTWNKTFSVPEECEQPCEGHHCDKPICEENDQPGIDQCKAYALGHFNDVKNSLPKYKDQVSYTVTWSVTGSKSARKLHCVAKVTRPNWEVKEDKSCACAVWNKQKCWRPAPECAVPGAPRFTAPGLTRGEALVGNDDSALTCTTCEQESNPVKQFACLKASWERLSVADGGFERETSRLAPFQVWRFDGAPGTGGMDQDLGYAASGKNNAWLWPPGGQISALRQSVPVSPSTTYTLSANIRTSADLGYGTLGVAAVAGPVSHSADFNHLDAYQRIGTTLVTGPNQRDLDVYLAMEQVEGGQWAQFDDVVLAPQGKPLDGLRQIFVARFKLFYDTRGEALGPQDRAQLGWLAYKQPGAGGVTLPCGDVSTLPSLPSACSQDAYRSARDVLAMCNRLAQEHMPAGFVSGQLGECLGALEQLGQLRDPDEPFADLACAGPGLRTFARDLVTRLLLRQQQLAAQKLSASADRDTLVRQLALLDRWYQVVRESLRVDGHADPDEAVASDLSSALAGLWDAVYTRENPFAALRNAAQATGADNAAVNAKLHELAGSGYVVDQAVVEAAFTSVGVLAPEGWTLGRIPLTGLPLLALLGDALTPLERRVDSLSVFHDFACTLRQGCGTVLVDTPIARTWQLLAGLANADELGAGLATSHLLAGWKPVFATLKAQHPGLAAALAGAGFDPASSSNQLPRAARPLARLILAARARQQAFVRTGQFDPTAHRVLAAGVDVDSRAAIVKDVNDGLTALAGARTTYNSNVLSFVGSLLGEVDTQASNQRIASDKLRLADRAEQIAQDIAGLEANGEAEEARFGSMGDRLDEISASIDDGAFTQLGDTTDLYFSGQSAKWSYGAPVDPVQIGAGKIPGLALGQLLVIRAEGQYKPTCALRQLSPMSPATGEVAGLAGQGGVGAADATIGPEGFQLNWNNSGYVADSRSFGETTAVNVGARTDICAGTPDAVSLVTGLSIKSCVHYGVDYTMSMNDSQSSGGQRNASASFAGGLRLSRTPFPGMPAGALLLVFTDRASGAIAQVHVVGSGQNAFVVPADHLDAHFVVNDVTDAQKCAGRPATPNVHLTANLMVDSNTAAAGAVAAMAAVLAKVRSFEDGIVQQGVLLPSQGASLRSESMSLLGQHLDLERVPVPVRRLFEAFVDKEILAVERRVHIRQLRREEHQLVLQMAALDEDRDAGADRSRLQNLLSRWALRNLDGDRLRSDAVALLTLVRSYFLPILEIWYPSLLDSFAETAALRALFNADVNTSMGDLVDSTALVLADLQEKFGTARRGQRSAGAEYRFAVVGFPNPKYRHRPGDSASSYQRAEASQSLALWEAIEERKLGTITVFPEDLYSETDGKVPCREHNPVIQGMAIYVVRPREPDAGQLNGIDRTFTSWVSPEITFARSEGPTVYQVADGAWQSNELPVVYGEADDAITNVAGDQNFRSQRPVGLSPFTSFTIDFSQITTIENGNGKSGFDAAASEILLVFTYDSKGSGDRLAWTPRCKASR